MYYVAYSRQAGFLPIFLFLEGYKSLIAFMLFL